MMYGVTSVLRRDSAHTAKPIQTTGRYGSQILSGTEGGLIDARVLGQSR